MLVVDLAETPDSISISLVNHTGAMVEGREYQLLCEVQNIAPVQYLTLRWYRGQTEVYNTTFSELSPATPVQVSSTLLITPSKAEDGAPYSCEAALELGQEGPQPSPRVKSESLSITVHCKCTQAALSVAQHHSFVRTLIKMFISSDPPDSFDPQQEVVELDDAEKITLNCSVGGNPPPLYSWSSAHLQETDDNQPLFTVSSSGTYTCTAYNSLGKSSKQFIAKLKSKGNEIPSNTWFGRL